MSIAKNPELYIRPQFNQALIEKFKPMIHMMIKKNVYGYNSSDVCYDWEDMYQECLIHLNEAVNKYDESKGMKFSNFAYMVFNSRLGNFRTKIAKNNFKTTNFTSIAGGWGITGSEVDFDLDEATISYQYQGIIDANFEDVQHQIMDAKLVHERLTGDRKQIYEDFYIAGKSVQEICNENEHLKYYQVRRVLKYLDQIHTTLVEGKELCLQ